MDEIRAAFKHLWPVLIGQPPTLGAATPPSGQWTKPLAFFTGATANGTSNPVTADGYAGPKTILVANPGTGTCTLQFQGSMDGVNWHNVGYQQIDNILAPARAVAAIAVAAASAHTYQLLDYYTSYQAVISGVAGAVSLTVIGAAVPEL